MKRTWDDFSLHTGVGGLVLPMLTTAGGAVLGSRIPEFGLAKGIASGVALPLVYYLILLLVFTPRKLWNDAQEQIRPAFAFGKTYSMTYERAITYGDKMSPQHETLRVVVLNTGVTTIDGVRARVVRVEPPADNLGNLPYTLPRHDARPDDPPYFFLPAGEGVPIDVLTYRYHDELCIPTPGGDVSREQAHFKFANYTVSIEVSGRNAASILGKFRIDGVQGKYLRLILIEGRAVAL